MSKRIVRLNAVAGLLTLLTVITGCASILPSYSPEFSDISPRDGEKNVVTIPTFCWTVEEGVTNVYLQIFPIEAFNMKLRCPAGEPILQLTNFGTGRQVVSLQNDSILKKRHSAAGPLAANKGIALEYDREYVWVLVGEKDGKRFHKAFRFRTMKN